MLNEFAYCPRLFHLMHVEGRWADNAFTEDGRRVHRRVDAEEDVLPPVDGGEDAPSVVRSVLLASESLGVAAKLDLCELGAGEPSVGADDGLTGASLPPSAAPVAVPVETKRGGVPDTPERSWEPERVQLMAQGLLLRAHGWRCDHGVLYFARSRARVRVPFTGELEARTLHLIAQARSAARATILPPPLTESPKCHGCSLNAICMPDETHALAEVPVDPAAPVRRLYPARDDAAPLYVQEQGAMVGKSGEGLYVAKGGSRLSEVRLKDVSQLVCCGAVTVSPAALHLLCEAGVPVMHLSTGGWFYGATIGTSLRNAYDRAAQFAAAGDPSRCLAFARGVVEAKGRNQRTLLRRNGEPTPVKALDFIDALILRVPAAPDVDALLGLEGSIAAVYFGVMPSMIRPKEGPAPAFDVDGRNRRPPRDPVNAMLSFAYALLTKECTVALLGCGLDPYWGFYHRPRHGRPALALDLMEEFRPLVADSAVLSAINTGMVSSSDFDTGSNGCVMAPSGRKALIRALEARLDQLATHPVFGYRCSWRGIIRLQAQLLARWLRGDVPNYIGIVTR